MSLLTTAAIMPGMFFDTAAGAVWAALVLGIVNITIKPILLICTCPLNLATFGLFSWVVNGITLLIVSSLTYGFYIDTYLDAVLGSFLMYIISRGLYSILEYQNDVDIEMI